MDENCGQFPNSILKVLDIDVEGVFTVITTLISVVALYN